MFITDYLLQMLITDNKKTNITLYNYRYEKNNQSTWVPHVFTLIRKEKLALQKQQLPWRRLYRGGKPPEDGCMKPKHVV
jgi:hypothetical protein